MVAYTEQRVSYIRRMNSLCVALLKRTLLPGSQRTSSAPPGSTTSDDPDALWANIKQYVQGADQEGYAESVWNSAQEWQWPTQDDHGTPISPLDVIALTRAVVQQRSFVERLKKTADYTLSEKQAIRTIISRSPGELAVFRRSHRTCTTLLDLQTKMAADMNDARNAPPTGITALLAAAENQQHPEHARVLATFRTLFTAGDRDDRPSRKRRMNKPAGPPQDARSTATRMAGYSRLTTTRPAAPNTQTVINGGAGWHSTIKN